MDLVWLRVRWICMRRRRERCNSFSLAGIDSASRGDEIEDAFGGERQHEAGEAAEEHADADEGSDDPDRAGGPGAPDHDSQDERNDAVDQKPDGAVAGTKLKELNELDDSLEEEITGEDKGEGKECGERVEDEVDASEEVDEAYEYL